MQPSNQSLRSVLKNPGFLNLWFNQILVQLSSNALNFTLIIWVFKLTDSSIAVSALLIAIYLPAVLFGLFAGVLVDITDRKKIILAIDLLLAVLFFSLIPFKFYYPLVLLIMFLINTLAQFYSPAEASAIPIVVKRHQLFAANSIFSTTLYICFLLGFGLAGPLIDHFRIDFIFLSGGILLSIAAMMALFFPSITNKADSQGRKLIAAIKRLDLKVIKLISLNEIRETLWLVRRKFALLFAILIMGGVQVVIGVMAVLIPSFFENVLHIQATNASYVLILPLGLGMITGGLFLGKLGNAFPRRMIVSRAVLLAGSLFLAVGLAPIFSPAIRYVYRHRLVDVPMPFTFQPSLSAILAAGAFLLGVAMVSIIIPSQTIIQENTPEEDRGKVFAVLAVAMSGLSLIPVFLVGVLADAFGALPIFIAMGGLIFLAGIFVVRPNFFFGEERLSEKMRAFLGQGHWKKS